MDGGIQIKMFQSNENVKYEWNGGKNPQKVQLPLYKYVQVLGVKEVKEGIFFQRC